MAIQLYISDSMLNNGDLSAVGQTATSWVKSLCDNSPDGPKEVVVIMSWGSYVEAKQETIVSQHLGEDYRLIRKMMSEAAISGFTSNTYVFTKDGTEVVFLICDFKEERDETPVRKNNVVMFKA